MLLKSGQRSRHESITVPLWDAGVKYKKFYVDGTRTRVCACVRLCARIVCGFS